MPQTDPENEYASRLRALQSIETRHARHDRLFAATKLIVGLLTVVTVLWLARYHAAYVLFLFIPLLVLIVFFVLHERVLRVLRRCVRLRKFYEQGMARLQDRWAGTGQQGDHFLDAAHPYARDLDIFGKGSLFESLCTARTRAGEDTLANWLLARASASEVKLRQAALQELAPMLDFREKLSLAGEDVRIGVNPEALIAWSESATRLASHKLLRIALPILAICWILSVAAWFLWDFGTPVVVISLLNLALTYKLHTQASIATAQIEEASHDLNVLASVLTEIEQMTFHSEKLRHLQSELKSGNVSPSRAISKLDKRTTWLEAHENWFVKGFDFFIFWTPQWVMAAEAWRAHHGSKVRTWITITGEIEALTALGSYAYEHSDHVFPEFIESGPYLHAEGMAHPLLPRSHAVPNDIELGKELQLLVISGPNMAGKSTFIRSVGINVVLAQMGAPVCARRFVLSSLEVAASICVLDSLQGGLSRFYAEITRLKTIDTLCSGPTPVLFLMDELLSGTNSHDRRIGTESFVRSLLSRNAIGLITTHDLALAKIAESLNGHAANFHFADSIENGKLHFDYRLTPGIVQTANALTLMRSIGLDV